MAMIRENQESLFRIGAFSGLNECPSGEAGLRLGEGAQCVNFRVTHEGSLQVRPGTRTLWRFPGPVEGIWQGAVDGREVKLAAAGGKLWRLGEPGEARDLGNIGPGRCRFFGFGGKVYLLTSRRYLVWTGYGQVTDVAGYRPVVTVSATPEGGGTLLEPVNMLTGARRAFYSPDGAAKVFHLPEGQLTSVDYVLLRGTGERLDFRGDPEAGTVTLQTAPAAGTNTLEIGWTKGAGQRGVLMGAQCAELFSGETDNRVFLYGDGTNAAYYSGVNYDGQADAGYFPQGNILHAGSGNTPITAMLRHRSRLLVFKSDGAFCVQAGSLEQADGKIISAFYVTPVQREMGCAGLDQATLVDNDPRTLWGGGVYDWSAAVGYAAVDERVARRVSEKVEESLGEMDLSRAVVFDDQARREWYVSQGGVTLVHNYRKDAWYRYEGLEPTCFGVLDGVLCLGGEDGGLRAMGREYRNDDGAAIHALWRSGSMDFDAAHRRKWGKYLWVGLKPESGGAVTVRTRTDRGERTPPAVVRAGLMSYRNADFAHWSYATDRRPRLRRIKPWSGPGAYGQVTLECHDPGGTATVLSLEGTLRTGRYAR